MVHGSVNGGLFRVHMLQPSESDSHQFLIHLSNGGDHPATGKGSFCHTNLCILCVCVCVPPFTLHLLTPPLFLHVSRDHNGLLLSVQGSCESDHPGGHASFSHR